MTEAGRHGAPRCKLRAGKSLRSVEHVAGLLGLGALGCSRAVLHFRAAQPWH